MFLPRGCPHCTRQPAGYEAPPSSDELDRTGCAGREPPFGGPALSSCRHCWTTPCSQEQFFCWETTLFRSNRFVLCRNLRADLVEKVLFDTWRGEDKFLTKLRLNSLFVVRTSLGRDRCSMILDCSVPIFIASKPDITRFLQFHQIALFPKISKNKGFSG